MRCFDHYVYCDNCNDIDYKGTCYGKTAEEAVNSWNDEQMDQRCPTCLQHLDDDCGGTEHRGCG